MDRKVILITGGSSGLGNAFCWRSALEGHTVVGTSRDPRFQPAAWELIPLDVMDQGSVDRAVERVIARHGRIDVLVNNAGIGIQGAAEDVDPSMAMRAFDTNFFGLHRMCRAVLPHMRDQGSGLIINIGSIIGNYGMPFRGFYSATKAAVDRYSEALRMEVRPFGIHVVVVEPGGYRTNIARSRLRPARRGGAYAAGYARSMRALDRDQAYCQDPDECAALVHRIIRSDGPGPTYRPGQFMARLSVLLKKVVPERLFEHFLSMRYGWGAAAGPERTAPAVPERRPRAEEALQPYHDLSHGRSGA
ncbi:MAG: SDR family oxidoreductase [Bacteroidetes bacterium]|nr:SDR family oxidoreductase [Bacteroidota bacterium]